MDVLEGYSKGLREKLTTFLGKTREEEDPEC